MANFPKGRLGEYMKLDAELGKIDAEIDRAQERLYDLKERRRLKFNEREEFARIYPQVRPMQDEPLLRRGAANAVH